MQIMPIDLTALVATILGISIVLVPVIGLTARFALNPAVEALSKLFEVKGTDDVIAHLERRLELQEQEISMLTQTVRGLTDTRDFDRQLSGPRSGAAPAPGRPGQASGEE